MKYQTANVFLTFKTVFSNSLKIFKSLEDIKFLAQLFQQMGRG